jgi:uncharacterized protein
MTDEEILQQIADDLNVKLVQVKNTVQLLDDGNTIPFIARYRKENTGSLDEEVIRNIQERLTYIRSLEQRKKTILKSIEQQGKLTPELQKKIQICPKLQELEDLYLPYRPKKRTRAIIAKENGLEPLAQIILSQKIVEGNRLEIAETYINTEKGVNNAEEALTGARDILAEIFSENAEVRKHIRLLTLTKGVLLSSEKGKSSNREYEMYFDYREPLKHIPAHRILAINRGEREKALKIEVEINDNEMIFEILKRYLTNKNSIFANDIEESAQDAYTRLIAPAIHREIRTEVTKKADKHAINVFALNLKNLLLQSPIPGKKIIGIDPGYRTGCKVAVIDETGKYLKGETIYPHPPQKEYFEAKTILRNLLVEFGVQIIAIGNGTASRETELMVAELINEIKNEREAYYTIVNEAGASVYSASKLAKEEFPQLDASMRGNISIARRLQDPLAELVKIDPRSVGVGLYQHDINQNELVNALKIVVESCVNLVGVDLNTASATLLQYVSGLNKKSARNLIAHRNRFGTFINREQLKEVEGIGEIAFQQAAGFLRIRKGDNPLDETSIHPESYQSTIGLLKKFSISDIYQGGKNLRTIIEKEKQTLATIAQEISCGLPTLEDILNDLEKPGRDPRTEMPKPLFRSDVLKIEDLHEGMILKGTVRNVVDFGAFIDIGVKRDGLLHKSQMATKFTKSPHEIISVGDIVDIKVLSVDLERGRISLSMNRKGEG